MLAPQLGSRMTGISFNPNSDLGLPRITVNENLRRRGTSEWFYKLGL